MALKYLKFKFLTFGSNPISTPPFTIIFYFIKIPPGTVIRGLLSPFISTISGLLSYMWSRVARFSPKPLFVKYTKMKISLLSADFTKSGIGENLATRLQI